MYQEYRQVQEFMEQASLLEKTSKTMEDIFSLTMERNKKEIAVQYVNIKGKIKKYNYQKMKHNTILFASTISKYLLDKPKHKPIVLKLANNPHWGELFYAILMSGYKPLLVNAKTSKEGTTNLINQSEAVAIITDDVYNYDVIKLSLDDILLNKEKSSFNPSWENEVIFCSSGTTGDVKLMVFNGENLVHQICCSLQMAKTSKDIMYPKKMGKIKILAMIPFHHIFGFVAVFLWYTYYGKTLVFPNSLASNDIRHICQKVGVSHIYSVPLFWDSLALGFERKKELLPEDKKELIEKMIKYNLGQIKEEEIRASIKNIVQKKIQKSLLGNKVRYCISGGGYLTSKTLTTINGLGYPLYNGYGMTEIGVTSVELSYDIKDRLKGSIGKPLHDVKYKIKDDKKEGELLVSSPTIHIKEIINGEIKNTTFDKDGYYATGDIASIDEDGSFYIKGRIKDVIINADGENIYPDEIEIYFKKLPHVVTFSILGVNLKNKEIQDIILVLEVENTISDEELISLNEEIKNIEDKLPHNVHLNDIYLAKKHLPLANNMKVKRFAIKKAIESNNGEYVSINANKQEKHFEDFDELTIKNILQPIKDLVSKVLILPKFKIDDNAHWINELGGDSMNYVELMQEINKKFDIEIPEENYGKLTCINDFVIEVKRLKEKK